MNEKITTGFIMCVIVASIVLAVSNVWLVITAALGMVSLVIGQMDRHVKIERDIFYLEMVLNEIVKKLNSEQLIDAIGKLRVKSQFGRPVK